VAVVVKFALGEWMLRTDDELMLTIKTEFV